MPINEPTRSVCKLISATFLRLNWRSIREKYDVRALICRQWGDVDQLKVAEVPPPVPTETEILIDVETTAVNYADAIMIALGRKSIVEFF